MDALGRAGALDRVWGLGAVNPEVIRLEDVLSLARTRIGAATACG